MTIEQSKDSDLGDDPILEGATMGGIDLSGSAGWFGLTTDHDPRDLGFTEDAHLEIEFSNIGGITNDSFEIPSGVTLFIGENATNRTSILEGIGAVLGGDTGSLKADATEGRVSLSVGDSTFTTKFDRSGSKVSRVHEGPWEHNHQHTVAVTNFVVLNETNPIRQAVATGTDADLYDLIMDPVDTVEIDRRIADLEEERNELTNDIRTLERQRKRLPELEERRRGIKGDIEEIEASLDDVEEDIATYELDRAEAEQKSERMLAYEELLDKRERLTTDLERQQDTIERINTEINDKQERLETFTVDLDGDFDTIEAVEREISQIDDEIADIEEMESLLRRLVRTTGDMLDAEDKLRAEFTVTDDVTAALDPANEELECWTCGSTVKREAIERRQERLQELAETKNTDLDELQAERRRLTGIRTEYQEQRESRNQLEAEIDSLEEQVENIEADVVSLEQQLENVEQEIEDLEAELEETDTGDEIDALLSAYQRRGELRNEHERRQTELTEVENEISEIEEKVEEIDRLEARRESVVDALEQYRGVVDDIETSVVEEFNDRMADVLELLAYDNIARVWIERKKSNNTSYFDLHIVREMADGTVHEDSIAHLSESEREVTSIVVALAGYLAHGVSSILPVLLLDSIEAIDTARIERLIEWIHAETETTHLVAVLLEEDATALPESYHRIRPNNPPIGSAD